jgi:chromosome segregation ATPase
MPKITGNLGVKVNGFLRLKINQPFLGMSTEVQSFAIASGKVDIEVPANPKETVYLVDFAIAESAPFNPVEQWTVPNYDVGLDELRAIERTSIRWLEKENKRLSAEHEESVSKANIKTEQLDIISDAHKAAIADLEQLKQQVEELELKVRELSAKKQELVEENEKLRSRLIDPSVISNLEIELSRAKHQIDLITEERGKLQDSMNSLKLICNEITETSEQQVSQIASLKESLIQADLDLQARSQELLELRLDRDNLKQEVELLFDELAIAQQKDFAPLTEEQATDSNELALRSADIVRRIQNEQI